MPSRRDFDAPAATIAAVLGVLVILVSMPFTVLAYREVTDTGKGFTIAWSQGKAETKGATLTASGPVQAQLTINGKLPAMVMVMPKACNDSATGSSTQSPATITVKLTRTIAGKTEAIGKPTSYACSNAPKSLQMETGAHPDIGSVTAKDEATARTAVEDRTKTDLRDVTYTVELTSTRPASTVPTVPVANTPTLSAAVELSATSWTFSATLPAEAGK